ncbi:MAG: recombinase RecT [Methanomicrobiales archaeon]|nr:recombinase RecT [Methanomicrobiales archaeon]
MQPNQNQRGLSKRPDAQAIAPTGRQHSSMDILREKFDRARSAIAEVAPKHVSPDRVLRLALAAAGRDQKLLDCTPASILMSTIQAAALGLEPSTALQQAYLVPYKINKKIGNKWEKIAEAQLIIGYRGYILLATQSDMSAIDAENVYAEDEFECEKGLNPKLRHVESDKADRGAMRGSYTVWQLNTGSKGFRYWNVSKLNAHRDKYARRDYESNEITGTWKDHYPGMCLKTVIRDASRFWPMSSEKIRNAIAVDDREAVGPDFTLIHGASERGTANVLEALGEGDYRPEPMPEAEAAPAPVPATPTETPAK